MQSSNVYVTIGLDKHGSVVEVRLNGGQPIAPREGKPGPVDEGGSAPGCEQVMKKLMYELLTCRKKTPEPTPVPTPPPTDPCCIRDPITGRIWCWC
jgi:hypothetical protein